MGVNDDDSGGLVYFLLRGPYNCKSIDRLFQIFDRYQKARLKSFKLDEINKKSYSMRVIEEKENIRFT